MSIRSYVHRNLNSDKLKFCHFIVFVLLLIPVVSVSKLRVKEKNQNENQICLTETELEQTCKENYLNENSNPTARQSGCYITEFLYKDDLSKAVYLHCSNPSQAFEKHGPIEYWKTSKINDFSELIDFSYCRSFNGDIGKWDVSGGTSFRSMFSGTYPNSVFNSDLRKWNVSRGTTFYRMFNYAKGFNSDLSKWDVSRSLDFYKMFNIAPAFNSDLRKWDVSRGTDFELMFEYAMAFNSDLSQWDVSGSLDFDYMFYYARSFSSNLCKWRIHNNDSVSSMFEKTGCPNQSDPKCSSGGKCDNMCFPCK